MFASGILIAWKAKKVRDLTTWGSLQGSSISVFVRRCDTMGGIPSRYSRLSAWFLQMLSEKLPKIETRRLIEFMKIV